MKKQIQILFMIVAVASSGFAQNVNQSTTTSQAKDYTKNYQVKWAVELAGDHREDALSNQTSAVLMGMKLDFDVLVNSWMALNLTPEFIAQSGYIQAPDAINPQTSRMNIENASLDLTPLEYIKASVGSLNERYSYLHSKIFIADMSFPAGRIILQTSPKSTWKLMTFGESAVPVSTTVSDNSNNLNKTPSLNTAGLGLDAGDQKNSWESHTHVNYYQFQNLPNSVMTSSVQLGNTGVPTAGSDYQLRYQYQGYEALTYERLRIARRWTVAGWASGLQNTQAPSDRNTGWLAGSSLAFDVSRDLVVIPKYEYYSIGADATLATYTSQDYDTNRAGYNIELATRIMRNYQIRLQYGQRVALIENPTQPDETIYHLKFESDELSF